MQSIDEMVIAFLEEFCQYDLPPPVFLHSLTIRLQPCSLKVVALTALAAPTPPSMHSLNMLLRAKVVLRNVPTLLIETALITYSWFRHNFLQGILLFSNY